MGVEEYDLQNVSGCPENLFACLPLPVYVSDVIGYGDKE
ncbi:hypothetical protein Bhyg_01476 [Pseudolycoriella hygida]|uniref:Uncharacterized protein n=1 Tax=Pseudolycoriella hygida TaxID=35572 RepID=A0A9Q0S7F3_9DIPT|nr:hypothetical protein Bhyg_01476 [Pseudolycoriella hygida]